jgi:hypothetical protein
VCIKSGSGIQSQECDTLARLLVVPRKYTLRRSAIQLGDRDDSGLAKNIARCVLLLPITSLRIFLR